MKNYEVLAPAGSIQQLVAAVNNGCNSVYLGLECFNARMKAPNFTSDNLAEWVDYCHLRGVKVYVTVNTSIKNEEYSSAVNAVNVVYHSGADGVILTDLELIRLAATLPKPFDVVASTQLSCHDAHGAEFLKNLGADTVVCARECSYSDVKAISSSGVKVECFLHGALCVCQSGQCLFSSLVGGNSGNRGLCAQPCRKKYSAKSSSKTYGSGYFLSARDVCGLKTASKLQECGATVFKIEGRNRRAEYAGATSRIYSKFFKTHQASKSDYTLLAEMFNRGGNDGVLSYLSGDNSNIIYKYSQSHMGVTVGKIANNCKAVNATATITKGDGFKVFDKNGYEVGSGVALADGIGIVPTDFSAGCKDGMTVNRTTSVELCKDVLSTQKKLDVSLHCQFFAGDKAHLQAICSGAQAEVFSDFLLQPATNHPTDREQIAKQLCKTGNTCYTICNIVVENDDIFLPTSQLNELRRRLLDVLTQNVLLQYKSKFVGSRDECITLASEQKQCSRSTSALAVICTEPQQIESCNSRVDFVIYKPTDVVAASRQELPRFCYLDLPAFADLSKLNISPNKFGLVCHNVGQVQFARNNGLRYIAGQGLNIFNDYIASMFSDADTFVYSVELTLQEISKFSNQSGLVFTNGKITLMRFSHCPYKAVTGCNCNSCAAEKVGDLTYTDELSNDFVIIRRKAGNCTFELVNGKKLSDGGKIQRGGRFLIDFNQSAIDRYLNLNDGIQAPFAENEPYTKGRLYAKIN